ncbi:MAG: YfbU family protein [Bacteroidales bacterium]|nr:YfbU family protein [Bacteroidales bacterium]
MKVVEKMEEKSLSLTERLILQNQYLILEKLYPNEGYAMKRKIVENGYKSHYYELFLSLTDKEMQEKDCKFVLDVLDMYKAIINSNNKLGENSLEGIYFHGFDGNNESDLLGYAEFFVFDLDRYRSIQEISGRSFNSNSEMRQKYEKMLDKWDSFKENNNSPLTKEQLEELLKEVNY